jgi:hypothetical protein
VAVEAVVGSAAYVDDATIRHVLVGASLRVPVRERLSVGPELVYSKGPDPQRTVIVQGSQCFDLRPATPDTRVVPYLVAGAGFQRQRDVIGYASGEGAFTAGGGARVRLADRIYVAGEVRAGWELHLRTAAHVGVTWPPR